MNWLDPKEVREWLAKRPKDDCPCGEPHTFNFAWAEFGRAVAEVETPDIDHPEWCRCYTCSTKKVARLIRDAEEGK